MLKNRFRAFALLMLATFFLFFLFLGSYPLLEPDEGRYSEIPREMIERGDTVTPTLNYVKYFEKPVLHYWLTAVAFKLFGYTEFASRFWPALMGALAVAFTFWLASTLHGTRAGFFAGLILATTWLHFILARINTIDMTLSAFITVALSGFLMGSIHDRRHLLLFYGGMALATLSKGLIGIVLPCAVAGTWILATRDWRLIRRTLYGWGILLFFALTLPWFVAVCLKNPEFFHFFFIREHLLRYSTRIHDRYEPVWYFIPVLLAGGIPWTGFWIRGLLRFRESREELYLILWFFVILLFFSFSSSKLPTYMLPVFPALSVLAGLKLERYLDNPQSERISPELVLSSLLLVPALIAIMAYPFFQERYPTSSLLGILVPIGGTLLLIVAATWTAWRKRRHHVLVTALFAGALCCCLAFTGVFSFLGNTRSSKGIADIIEERRHPDDTIVMYGFYDQGIPFYLKTRIVLVEYRGELEFGSQLGDQSRWFIDKGTFLKRWNSERHMVLVLRENLYRELLEGGTSNMRILGKSGDKIVVTNRSKEEDK